MQEFSYSNMPGFGKQDASDWKSLALAGFVHLLLLAFLWIGVQWQSHVTAVEEVEFALGVVGDLLIHAYDLVLEHHLQGLLGAGWIGHLCSPMVSVALRVARPNNEFSCEVVSRSTRLINTLGTVLERIAHRDVDMAVLLELPEERVGLLSGEHVAADLRPKLIGHLIADRGVQVEVLVAWA